MKAAAATFLMFAFAWSLLLNRPKKTRTPPFEWSVWYHTSAREREQNPQKAYTGVRADVQEGDSAGIQGLCFFVRETGFGESKGQIGGQGSLGDGGVIVSEADGGQWASCAFGTNRAGALIAKQRNAARGCDLPPGRYRLSTGLPTPASYAGYCWKSLPGRPERPMTGKRPGRTRGLRESFPTPFQEQKTLDQGRSEVHQAAATVHSPRYWDFFSISDSLIP